MVHEYKPLMLPIKSFLLSLFTVKGLHRCLCFWMHAQTVPFLTAQRLLLINTVVTDTVVHLATNWPAWLGQCHFDVPARWTVITDFHWPKKDVFRTGCMHFLGNAFYCHNRLHLYGVKMSEEQKWHGVQHLPLASFVSFLDQTAMTELSAGRAAEC